MTTIILNTLEVTEPGWRAFVAGMSEAFNLRGTSRRYYHFAPNADAADASAIQNDWETVGADFSQAMSQAIGRR